jgi:hypothetical protein
VAFDKQHVLIVHQVIIILVMVRHNAPYAHPDIPVLMLVLLLFLVYQVRQLENMDKYYVHHVVPATLLILLVKQLATFALLVVNVVIPLSLQSNVSRVNIAQREKFHVQHVLLVIKQLSLEQPIVMSVDLVNIFIFRNNFL